MISCVTVTTVNQAARHGNLSRLKKLIKNGHPFDVLDNQGWSALHESANYNHISCLQYLLQKFKLLREKINLKAHDGCTALHLATKNANIACMQLLMQHGALPDITNFLGEAPIHVAITTCNLESIRLLIENKCDLDIARSYDNSFPLHLAVEVGWSEGLEELLKAGASPACQQMHNMTPLFMAAQKGDAISLKILLNYNLLKGHTLKNCDILSMNLVDLQACDHATPLFIGSQHGHTEIVRILLEAGADANLTTIEPVSLPLHAAVEFNHIDCFDILLPRTDLTILSQCEVNILKLAIRRDNNQILFDKIIDINKPIEFGAYNIKFTSRLHHHYPESLAEFDSKVQFDEYISVLTYIVLHDANQSHAQYLISHGFDVNESKSNTTRFCPIHAAVLRKNSKWLEFLIENNCSLNVYHPNVVGNVLLIMSIFDLPFFYLLLQYGADADSLFQFHKNKRVLSINDYFMPIKFLANSNHFKSLNQLLLTFSSSTGISDQLTPLSAPRSLFHLSKIVIRNQISAYHFYKKLTCLQNILPVILIEQIACNQINIEL